MLIMWKSVHELLTLRQVNNLEYKSQKLGAVKPSNLIY